MAFKADEGSSYQSGGTALVEINVTPLVDVILVLLIIFMISAPMMQQGVQVDLPKANSGTLAEVPEQVVLSITAKRELLLNGKVLKAGTLQNKLESIAAAKPNVQVFIHADQAVNYGLVAQVMAEVKKAKISRVGMVTAPGDPNLKL